MASEAVGEAAELERRHPGDGDGDAGEEDEGERRQDAAGAALVEAGEREAAPGEVASEDAGDQVAGDHEEDVDAEVAAGEGGEAGVEQDDRQHGDGAQAVDLAAVAGARRGMPARGRRRRCRATGSAVRFLPAAIGRPGASAILWQAPTIARRPQGGPAVDGRPARSRGGFRNRQIATSVALPAAWASATTAAATARSCRPTPVPSKRVISSAERAAGVVAVDDGADLGDRRLGDQAGGDGVLGLADR